MSESFFTTYNIRMRTSIGIRLGHMTVCRTEGTIHGSLDILRHSEPFAGTVDADGNCRINGKIVTLMRTIDYAATGRITPNSLILSFTDDRHVLEITGTPSQP